MSGAFSTRDRWFLLILGLIYMFNFIDRTIISVLGEAIRKDLALSDLQLGLMGGLAFSFFYAALGIPLARLAERHNRVRIIAAVTALWSLMTMLCGAAGSFVQLLLCRMGVGVGEAGFTPALVSMISDRFAPGRRAFVFSVIAVGVPLGGAIAAVAGGAIAQTFGWRLAFAVVGLPGLLLALLLYLTVPEPPRDSAGDVAPSFGAVLRRLGRSPAFLHLTFGSGMVGLVGFGLNLFLIPLLVRRHGMDLSQAGLAFALSFSLATALGTLVGGHLADRLGRRDIRWYGWTPALLLCLGLPLYVAAIYQDDWRLLMGLLFLATACLYAFLPTIMTVTQTLVEPRMRASAAAIHSFGQTVMGLGLGSVLLGYLSDRLAAAAFAGNYAETCLGMKGHALLSPACHEASAVGLQRAMIAIAAFLLLSIASYLAAARNLPREVTQ
ncbi:MFS transporter [Sphingomonas sp. DBB INV C78]|uniref:spinster family MFS transporter n=1 Tax=Sphingomonas sp. DBB INV C78 TaxID=3349434 RepID=UPI0036D3253A